MNKKAILTILFSLVLCMIMIGFISSKKWSYRKMENLRSSVKTCDWQLYYVSNNQIDSKDKFRVISFEFDEKGRIQKEYFKTYKNNKESLVLFSQPDQGYSNNLNKLIGSRYTRHFTAYDDKGRYTKIEGSWTIPNSEEIKEDITVIWNSLGMVSYHCITNEYWFNEVTRRDNNGNDTLMVYTSSWGDNDSILYSDFIYDEKQNWIYRKGTILSDLGEKTYKDSVYFEERIIDYY